MHLIYDIAGGIALVICAMVAVRCVEDVRIKKDDSQ